MSRNVRGYGHFCFVARALELVGDRWSLLVVRDLLTGPKRFTDLQNRLGVITPKTLTQRLRELDECGLVATDRQTGRREVWYSLTPAGRDLGPVVDELHRWGWRHIGRPPQPGEQLHIEHMLSTMAVVLDEDPDDGGPACWHLRFPDEGHYTLESDGDGWSVAAGGPAERPDVVLTATTTAWFGLIFDPQVVDAPGVVVSDSPAPFTHPRPPDGPGIEVTGDEVALRRFEQRLRTFSRAITQRRAQSSPTGAATVGRHG